jgi:hypothetical protein
MTMSIKFATLDEPTRKALVTHYLDTLPINLALPHDVYTLAVDDIRRGVWRPIGPIAIRLMEIADDEAIGACEISAGPDGTPHLTHRMVESPYLAGTLDALTRLERAGEGLDAEFRLLRVPFLPLVAGWLFDRDGRGGDLLSPISPMPLPLSRACLWSPEDLIAALAELNQP